MTRKHFKALAAALKDSKPDEDGLYPMDPRLSQWRADVRAIATVHPQPSLTRFYAACGYELSVSAGQSKP